MKFKNQVNFGGYANLHLVHIIKEQLYIVPSYKYPQLQDVKTNKIYPLYKKGKF